MTIYSSGNQISLQGTSDTNPTGQTFHLDTTITSASTSCSIVGFTRTTELSDAFYGTETTLSGTVYGFKTAQTSEYSGTARLTRGFDDTNPQVASNSAIKGAGFFGNSGWFGSAPHNAFSSETWWTSAGVVGVTLGVDENSLGSISTQSYTGGGSVGTLEVHQFGWFNNASSNYPNGTTLNTSAEGNWIMLVLKNTSSSPPNSNDSFYSVQINGQEFLRSDAATTTQSSNASYDSNVSSGTHYYRTWRWDAADVTDSDLTAIGTTGSKTFKLSKSAPSTLNTGIAEEMGGADSSNVRLSDYYRNGDLIGNVTGIPEEGSPSAQIKFSDFYGKTFVPQIFDHSTTLLPDYWATGGGYITNYFSGYQDGSTTTTGQGDTLGDATFPNSGSITFGGLTRSTNDIEIVGAYFLAVNNGSTTQQFYLVLEDHSADHGTSWTKTGFTAVEIYLDQSDTSGSPDLTLAIADANITFVDYTSYTQAKLFWSTAQSFSNYFGTNSTPSNNGTQTISITGLA